MEHKVVKEIGLTKLIKETHSIFIENSHPDIPLDLLMDYSSLATVNIFNALAKETMNAKCESYISFSHRYYSSSDTY